MASQRTNRLAWLVEVGRFLEDRWLAEETLREEGEPLDENATWPLWDQCTEKYLRDLRTEARQLLQRDLRRGRLAAVTRNWATKVAPLHAFTNGMAWTLAVAGKAIVGAISVIAFGLFMLWLFPGLTNTARSTFDRIFPDPEQITDAPADSKRPMLDGDPGSNRI